MTKPSIAAFRRSLEVYDRNQTAAAVERIVEQRVSIQKKPARASGVEHLAADLSNFLGDWYRYGPTVGDETVTGFCWCHSLQAVAAEAPTERVAQRVTEALMAEIDGMYAWRISVLATIDASIAADVSDEDALVAVVERVIGLGIWDAWYWNATAAAHLLLEASGRAASEALLESIQTLTETTFTSWSEPESDSINSFAEQAAWAIVEAELDRRHS